MEGPISRQRKSRSARWGIGAPERVCGRSDLCKLERVSVGIDLPVINIDDGEPEIDADDSQIEIINVEVARAPTCGTIMNKRSL